MKIKYIFGIVAIIILVLALGCSKKTPPQPTQPSQPATEPNVPTEPITKPTEEETKATTEATTKEVTNRWVQDAALKPDAIPLVKNVFCENVEGLTDKERVGQLKFDVYNPEKFELFFIKKGLFVSPSKLIAINFNGVNLANLNCGDNVDSIQPESTLTCTLDNVHFKKAGENRMQVATPNFRWTQISVC